MSIRELIPQPKCGYSLRVSLQEEDPIAVFVEQQCSCSAGAERLPTAHYFPAPLWT